MDEAFGSDNTVSHAPTDIGSQTLEQFTPSTEGVVRIPDKILSGEQVNLTVSQIDDYLRCPLNFYYKHVLCAPEEPSPSRDYGSILHKVIEDINRSLMAGEQIDGDLEAKLISECTKGWLFFAFSARAGAKARAIDAQANYQAG